jgi:uncharacterized sodium:solute symporter family permease YidK
VSGRRQARIVVAGIAIVAIALATIFEPPGTAEGIGYAVVLVVLVLLIVREMRANRAG